MKHNENRGFSLVELLVSIAILSIIKVMVVQFMGAASVSLRKTRKKIDIQTEAMEFREQFSDVVMQATYIRVQTKDKKKYEIKTTLDSVSLANRKKKEITVTDKGSISGSLVVDNYPNYCVAEPRNLSIYMNENDFTLFGRDATGADKIPSDSSSVQSFRVLRDGTSSGEPYYVKPQYIYVRYQPTYDTNRYLKKENYAIYRITDDNKIYVAKGTITNADTATDDGFLTAKAAVDAKSGYDGLMVQLMNYCYLSADTLANTIYIEMQLYDTEQPKARRGVEDAATAAKYTSYTYDYTDSIMLRNSYALTVAPNKMFVKEALPSPTPEPEPTPTPEP